MNDKYVKKDITIHVQPYLASATIGLIRGFLPAILEQLRQAGLQSGITVNDEYYGAMKETLDEIYEKCIAHTDIRESAAEWMDMLEMTDGVWPADKES
uniref:hypothetical protein n=1 Tax=Alistipes sp. D31t1_170403_E11 TaxID=2787128 RepID=UPI001E652FE3|nr:hypothetical protein [Alistipes sp. D31t1_170403_E11]